MSDSATLWAVAYQAFLSFTISLSLLKLISLSQWCRQTISIILCCPLLHLSSVFLRIRGFFNELELTSGGQKVGASASASVPPMNIQNWFPLELTGLISLQSKGLSRVFANTTVQKHQFFSVQPSLWSNLTWPLSKEQKITSVGKDVKKLEYLFTVGGNVKWCIYYGKQHGSSSKN